MHDIIRDLEQLKQSLQFTDFSEQRPKDVDNIIDKIKLQAQSDRVAGYTEGEVKPDLVAVEINADHITKYIADEIEKTLKIAFCFDNRMAGIDKESIIELASKLKSYFSSQTV